MSEEEDKGVTRNGITQGRKGLGVGRGGGELGFRYMGYHRKRGSSGQEDVSTQ